MNMASGASIACNPTLNLQSSASLPMVDIVEVDPDIEFKWPGHLRSLIIGASQSGKSTFMTRLLAERARLLPTAYEKIVFCSPNFNDRFNQEREDRFKETLTQSAHPIPIDFLDHIVTEEELQALSQGGRSLIMLDDWTVDLYRSPIIVDLMIRLSSKQGVDIIMSAHVALGSALGKNFGIVFNSLTQVIFMRNLTHQSALRYIGRRIFPEAPLHITQCLNEATRLMGRYSHAIVDCSLEKQLTERCRVSCNAFSDGNLPVVYFANP